MATFTYNPTIVTHPGETLSEFLESFAMSQKELSVRVKSAEKTISEIVNGKSGISAEMAVKLETVFGIAAIFWLNLQSQFDTFNAEKENDNQIQKDITLLDRFSCYAELEKWDFVSAAADDRAKVINLMKFFGVISLSLVSPADQSPFKIAFRRSERDHNEYSLAAWLRCGELQVLNRPDRKDFNKKALEARIESLRNLTNSAPERYSSEIVRICAEAGVVVVFTPYLKSTFVNGATRWVGNTALIQLTERYKRNDTLWFTFFHEIGHIIKHGKKDTYIETSGASPINDDEREANNYAANVLIPEIRYSSFTARANFSRTAIGGFARDIAISPDIVAGRLAKDKLITWAVAQTYVRKITLRP